VLPAKAVQACADVGGEVGDALVEIAPRRPKRQIPKQVLEKQFQRAAIGVDFRTRDGGDARKRIKIGRDELDIGIDTDGPEKPPGD
jgi:hypothetical protein